MTATSTELWLGVLGPVQARLDNADTDLGGPKQRAVLAMLVASAKNSISRDRIIEGVWGEEAPDIHRQTFYTYVSHLRGILGDVIARTGTTYWLDLDRVEVDHLVFATAVDRARSLVSTDPGSAAIFLREALALWRGRPFADLVDVPGLDPEVRRLEELRLEAVELRVDAELAAGFHGSLIAEVEALANEHPTRERFRAQHMLALYRSGRQAEALRAYRRTESFLAEELGVGPSRELQDLELKILQHDDSLLGGPGRAETQRLAVLVSDIEGSTRLWDLHPQAMAGALTDHDRVLRQAVKTAGGRVSKHTGEGVVAVFPDTVSAAGAAEAAQRGLASAEWGDVAELRVRIGIDVGEVETRGGDFFGPPMNRAVRLCSAAHGGQVLVSAAAQAEIMASAPAGVQVRQLGEHQMRGIASRERVGQLVFEGLPADFPDLRVDADTSLDDHVRLVSLPGYEVRDLLGEGAVGAVWRAYQPSVGREVAIKVIRPALASRPSFVRRFEAEARTIARLAHPHIVPLIDFWRDAESAYLVLGILPGGTLVQVIEQGTVDRKAAHRILTQLGAALDHAHSHGVVHGDLKPANVLLDGAGNAYLSDFGIAARLLDPGETLVVSSAPSYRAPEVAETGPSPASDIYALGVLAHDLLSAPEIDVAVSRATALNPEARYRSAEAFLAELRQALGEETIELDRPVVFRNPYKGLSAFDEADAADFYGRDELIASLLTAVSENRFVTVVGPSGSGKSSAVRAGMLPALATGAVERSEEWFRVVMTPGSDPIASLSVALEAVSNQSVAPDGLLADGIGDMVDGELLVVVDQFEELYTLVDSAKHRDEFIDLLIAEGEDPESRVRVVATLRADFYHRPLQDDRLGRRVRDGLVTVLPPAREELVEMITAPSKAVGLRWEPGLPHRIAEDVAHQPGGLPLLQYALTELVERRSGDLLTPGDYIRVGGVAGALAGRAEAVYQDLTPSQEEANRQILLRLVTVDEDRHDIRRRVRRSELESLGIGRADLDPVLDRFIAERLLIADHDANTRSPTVEVAHEALLREWPRLRDWLDDEREGLILGRRFRASLEEWSGSGHDDDYLLTGTRLAPFVDWAEASTLTIEEQSYYQASKARDEAERAARRRRVRTLTAVLAAAAVVSSTLGTVAFVQGRQAAAAEARAEAEARAANTRRLTVESRDILAEDPELAILLALEAAYLSRDAGEPLLSETIASLHQAVQASRLEFGLDGEISGRVAVSPDGTLLAASLESPGANPPGDEVAIWDADTGERLKTLVGEGTSAHVVFSPDGSVLAVPHWDLATVIDPPEGYIGLRDTATWEEIGRLPHSGVFAAWSPDGEFLATSSSVVGRRLHLVVVFEVNTGREVLRTTEGGGAIVFVDRRTLAVGDRERDRVVFYDILAGDEIGHLDISGEPRSLVFDPDRALLLVGMEYAAELWSLQDPETPRPEWSGSFPTAGGHWSMSAGTGVVKGSTFAGSVLLVDLEDGSVVAEIAGAAGASFYPGGDRLTSDGGVWNITPAGPPLLGNIGLAVAAAPHYLQISPDGSEVVVTHVGTSIRYNLANGDVLGAVDGKMDWGNPAPVSPDWSRMAFLDSSGQGWVRDLVDRADIRPLPACASPRGFSHDASMLVLDGVTLCEGAAEAPLGAQRSSRLIGVDTGDVILDFGQRPISGPSAAVFNPEGVFSQDRYLAIFFETADFVVEVYDLETGAVFSIPDLAPMSLAFDPSGRYLAGGRQGSAFVLDLVRLFDGHPEALIFDQVVGTGGVPTVALNSDGILATAIVGSRLRLWNIHTGQLFLEFATEWEIPHAVFSPNGDYLYYVDSSLGSPVLRRFPLDTNELIAMAESRLTRGPTHDECQRYALGDICLPIGGMRPPLWLRSSPGDG